MTSTAPRAPSRWLLPTLTGYRKEWLRSDVLAGVSAGAVIVPQAMAYATIANMPVEVGLYTCIVPMLVYAILGGSRAMSVSTTSTIATLTATTLVTAGIAAGSDDALGSLMALTLLVGGLLLLARALRLGVLVENISGATVLGVKVGVGATVAVGQLPTLLGETDNASGEGFVGALVAASRAYDSVSMPTVALSAASIVLLLLLKRFAPRFPAELIVASIGILLVWALHIDAHGVALIEPVSSGLPLPGIPDFTHIGALIPGALAIAVMSFLESAAVARSLRSVHAPQIDSDQELLATGAANVAGAFFTTLPAAGGFSQSAVNQSAGAKTQVSTLVAVALAVLVALFLGPVISLLPQATLAAMVLVAVVGLIDIPKLVRWARISPVDFWVALVVAIIALTAGLLAAVAGGVILTLLVVIRELDIPNVAVTRSSGSAVAFRFTRGLYTANVAGNVRRVEQLATELHPRPDFVVLDMRQQPIVTITVLDALERLDRDLAEIGITVHIAALPSNATAVALKVEWFQELADQGRVHATVEDGLASAKPDRNDP